MSCHGFLGLPSPAGIFVSTRSGLEKCYRESSRVLDSEYRVQVPVTITCSRDAVKAAEFHDYSSPEALERRRLDAAQILNDAR